MPPLCEVGSACPTAPPVGHFRERGSRHEQRAASAPRRIDTRRGRRHSPTLLSLFRDREWL